MIPAPEFPVTSSRSVRLRATAALHQLAAYPQKRWVLATRDAEAFAAGLLALAHAGKTIILPPSLQPSAVHESHMRAEAFLGDGLEIATKMPVLAVPATGNEPDLADPPGDTRLEFFTSGSTGTPKRVIKLWRQLAREVSSLQNCFDPLLGSATVIGTVPHYHVYGMLFRILWPLASGREFVSRQCPAPGDLVGKRSSIIVTSPAFLSRLPEPDMLKLAAPLAVFSSGGALPQTLAVNLSRELRCPLIEVYGSTETGGIAWRKWPDTDGSWRCFPGVQIRVPEQDGAGELHVRSAATDEHWLATGDCVEILDTGRIKLLGRIDGVIKLEDKRVSIAAIEQALCSHDWVSMTRIITLNGRRTELAAAVRLSSAGGNALKQAGRAMVSKTLRHFLRERFDPVTIPRKWRYVESLPINDMGKTTAADLAALFSNKVTS